MSEIIFKQPMMFWLLLLVPVFAWLFRIKLTRQHSDIQQFGGATRGRKSIRTTMEPWRLALLLLATSLIVLALSRPAISPQPKPIVREGRDVVFMLDVSKSMLAEDRLPNRLESAKSAIAECVDSLESHRFGLVVFAGSSSIVCPLTLDADFFLEALEKTGPESVAHGGTRIGDALLKTCDKLFSDSNSGHRDIVLLSDGGDHSDGIQSSIEQLNAKNIRLLAIGLGDETTGARIPTRNGGSDHMLYKGHEVWSKLDGALLSQLVQDSKLAAYIPVGTRKMNLSEIYHRISTQEGSKQLASESVIVYQEIFHWCIALAAVLLLVMAIMPHALKRPRSQPASVITALALLCLIAPHSLGADKALSYYQQGNDQYRDGAYDDASLSYENALAESPSPRLVRDITYNLANSYFKAAGTAETDYVSLSLIEQSIAKYRLVLLLDRNDKDASINNELARIRRKQLKKDILEQESLQQEMQKSLDDMRAKLIQIIDLQKGNLPRLAEVKSAPPQWSAKQQAISKGTNEVSDLIKQYNASYFKGMPPEVTPLKNTRAHVSTAHSHQKLSLTQHLSEWVKALDHADQSLQYLKKALLELPQEPQSNGKQKENSDDAEGDEDTEEGEGEDNGESGEEGEPEAGENSEGNASDTAKMDLETIDLPPPSNSPEDIIRMSQEIQQARKNAASKKQGTPVEKDW